ncbi:uncharacterized protein cubi_00052 [Cryptosporidium ubiquitum]|uniref:Uncharacterized protein n=1 Tax=Cryptosporidium ubiquitum TaxID=857276 RepID=A0A1J4MM14_9CRYT|nr:uncharacterized protein cubi_00052 [Cryptosporidium ubiquitum]OII74499.1 hypothetical protein cubi_00052 [Cryptosporidium ubiquitum]
MSVFHIILSLIIILLSLLYIFIHIFKTFLQKKGFEVSFSISGFFSLGNLKIKILEKCLEKYNHIGGFELILPKISVRIQSWKFKIILNESYCVCFVLNKDQYNKKELYKKHDHHPFSHYTKSQGQISRNNKIDSDSNIGIIRNLMLIVMVQIFSRIISFELEKIQFKVYIIDCKCIVNHRNLKINQDGNCEKCNIKMKYGIYSILDIQSLSIFPKAYLGGIMVNIQLDNPVLYLNPIENTISEKRCHTFYLDSNNKYNQSSKNGSSIFNYLLEQYYLKYNKSILKQNHENKTNYPPLLYVNNRLNITMKLMHSMSGSDIRVCILRNVNIEMNQLWLTLIPEIVCELIYVFHIIKSNWKKSTKTTYNKIRSQMLDPNIINQSDPIIKLSPKYQLLSNNNILPTSPVTLAPPSSPNISYSSPFSKFEDQVSRTKQQKLIMNENLDRQLQINFKISQPSLIFCDNTQSSSGFEILFHDFEAHFIIQYFVEYLQSSLKLYNQDYDFELSNSESSDINLISNISNQSDLDNDLKKKIRRSLKLVFGSKLIFGNSILYSNPKENHLLSKQIMPNTIKDGDFTFDRMFIIEHYKSIIEISDNNFVKLYLKNSIQRMFGIWRENGFYQNLTLFLQLIKFQKYLSKIKIQANSSNNNHHHYVFEKPFIDKSTEEIPKIPIRIELEDDDILKSDFLIKNNNYLKEIMTIKDFAVNLLFYLEIKEMTIQTNDISCFNHELHILKKNDCCNCHCEDCFTESFGPKERYEWRTDFDSEYDSKFTIDEKENQDNPDIIDDRFFVLNISNLKICNTSLNRSFSMLFSDVDLYSMQEFVDLEDISTKYLNLATDLKQNNDILDLQKTCIYRYGCFDQRIQAVKYKIFPKIKEKNHLVKLNESIIISPWDHKRISLRFKGIHGNLHTCYVPLYLYILGCFSIDCLALKKTNLNKVYYGINNQFEENFDFYCNQRSNYFEKFKLIKKDLIQMIKEFNPEELNNRNVELWTIPDIIQSKVGSLKYTWYFDFDDISVNFLDGFKILMNKLSLYRCNEYGNYDIQMNHVKIFDIFGINILSSSKIRMRSDIPFKTTKIKSPICLKKQLRRIIDLSVNGDLLLLSILGNQENSENNLKDIKNGMIFFDSKRFILEIDQLDILLLVNCQYRESLFKYLYQYIYITFYQLFHPPIIIRTGKLLSFSRKHPIIFSCNNIFDFLITKMTLSLSSLANFMFSQDYERFPVFDSLKTRIKKCSKDDLNIQYKLKPNHLPTQRPKVGLNNILNFPISEVKFDNLRLNIRTKHTSNSKSPCNDKECYNIPNYLTNSISSEERFLINSNYNPINIFVSLVGLSLNMFNQLSLTGSKATIYSRKEVSLTNESIIFDFRRNYSHLDSNVNENMKILKNIPEMSSDIKISIYSKSKTSLYLSNFSSFKTIKLLNPILELIKNSSNFKLKLQKNKCETYSNEFSNIIISRNTLTFSLLISDLTSLYLVPYINFQIQKEMSDNSSVNIHLPKIELNLKKNSYCDIQEMGNFLNQLEAVSLFLNDGILIGLVSKEIFAPLAKRKCQGLSLGMNPTQQRYSLKSTLISISKFNINLIRNSSKEFDIKLVLNGLDRESIIEKYIGNDSNRSDTSNTIPLTLNLDSEKLVQFSTILESFLDENNFEGISLYYCEDCNQLKPIKSIPLLKSQQVLISEQNSTSIEGIIQSGFNFLLRISLNDINLRYEIFSLLIKDVWLDLSYFNSEMKKFLFGINQSQFIAEYFPYILSQLSKPSQSFKILRGSNIQISSNFSSKTKVLEIARIGSILFDISNNDSVLLVLKGPQLNLNTLTFVYLEVLIKIFNVLKLNSEGGKLKKENSSLNQENNAPVISIIPGKKFNIQIYEIMINTHSLGTNKEYKSQKDDRKIRLRANYSGAKKTSRIPDLDTQSEFLFQVIEQNPIYSTFTLVDDFEDSNTNFCIFQSNNSQSCLECRYHLNRPLIYSSKICTEQKSESYFGGISTSSCSSKIKSSNKSSKNQLDDVFRKYCNEYFSFLDEHLISDKYQKSSFEMIQEYRKICMYTESNIGIPFDYGQIIDNMILGKLGYGKKAGHIYFSRSFTQIICRIPQIDCSVGIYDSNRKFEFVLKMFPVSIDIFLSNRLIWDSFGDSINQSSANLDESSKQKKEDLRIFSEISNSYSLKPLEPCFCDDYNEKIHPHIRSCSNQLNSEVQEIPKIIENFEVLNKNSSSSSPISSLEETQSERKRSFYECSQEILKTTPIFVSVRIHTGKPSTQLKIYSKLLSVSIDSSRVQSINEILYSFELKYTNKTHQPYQDSQNMSNPPSIFSSSNNTFVNNHTINVSSATANSVTNENLPPPIYYSHSLNATTGITNSGEQAQNLSLQSAPQVYNLSVYSSTKIPSVLSFQNYLYEQRQEQGQRMNILNVLNLNKRMKNNLTSSSLDLNPNRMFSNMDLNDKNVINMLKFEIDKFLANNPLFYTVVDNVQCQGGGDNNQVNHYKLQIECIIDQLNIDMFINNRRFSNFQSKDINFVMFSNNKPSNSTIIEFDTSFIYLSASKDYIFSNNSSNVNSSTGGTTNYNNNSSGNSQISYNNSNSNQNLNNVFSTSVKVIGSGNVSSSSLGSGLNCNSSSFNNVGSLSATENGYNVVSQEEVSIIHPMYIDGHTNQGHGHVLSIRINMRQVRLLEIYNIRILESVVIRVHPIRVNITQYLTSCYYDIFFPPPNNNQPSLISIQTGGSYSQSSLPILNAETEAVSSNIQEENTFYSGNTQMININASSDIIPTADHENPSPTLTSKQSNNSSVDSQNCSPKNILYFNYLRISSILVEVTYRGSVSLNNVLLELSSFTQRRKHRTVKEMVDKYISFLRRQAARPVISYTFKQLRHSLLPKHFKSHKRSSNFNSQYNDIAKGNIHGNRQINGHERYSKLSSSYQNILVDTSHNGSIRNYNNINSILPNNDEDFSNTSSRKIQSNNYSKNDSEYNKFKLIFGNQLLI